MGPSSATIEISLPEKHDAVLVDHHSGHLDCLGAGLAALGTHDDKLRRCW